MRVPRMILRPPLSASDTIIDVIDNLVKSICSLDETEILPHESSVMLENLELLWKKYLKMKADHYPGKEADWKIEKIGPSSNCTEVLYSVFFKVWRKTLTFPENP